jgi:hypothetical protein
VADDGEARSRKATRPRPGEEITFSLIYPKAKCATGDVSVPSSWTARVWFVWDRGMIKTFTSDKSVEFQDLFEKCFERGYASNGKIGNGWTVAD